MTATLSHDPREGYVALVRQRRLYGSLVFILVAACLVAGFRVAEDRNAGGFIAGLPHFLDFPADVVAEAWARKAELPGLQVH